MTTEAADYDYGDDAKTVASADLLLALAGKAQEQADAEAKVAQLTAELEAAKEALRKVSTEELPAMMDELGLAQFRTTEGITIDVGEEIRAGISKQRQPAAHKWLRENGSGKLIKSEAKYVFAKGEEEQAKKFLELVKKAGFEDIEMKESVHVQTLTAWVREQLQLGREFPQDLFGVFRQRVTKISR